jgi:ribonuclease D
MRRIQDKKTIQGLMHYHGVEEFLAMVSEAMGDACEDTEHMEDKNVTSRYEVRKLQLDQMIGEQPTREELREMWQERMAEAERADLQSRRIFNGEDV